MSKSLAFCQERASNPLLSSYFDRDWGPAQEIPSEEFFDKYIHGARKIILSQQEKEDITVDLIFDPDASFDYFTNSSSINDGTMVFTLTTMEEIVMKILNAGTYDNRKEPHGWGDHIQYTLGNFVVLHEFGDFSTWMKSRVTVLLPIKYDKQEEGC